VAKTLKAEDLASFQILNYGLRDLGEITQRETLNGWFWGALPSLFLGLCIRWLVLGALHSTDRLKQARKPLMEALNNDRTTRRLFSVYILIFAGLLTAALIFLLK